jgi:D-glycero-alpha-D-manno-heptose-7-phosphate kinase
LPTTALKQVVARAPTRIDLGGGWTDVPPYCDREGGFVCNIAIARYSTATLQKRAGSDEPLVRAALRRSGLSGYGITLKNDFPMGAGLGGSSAASAAILGATRRVLDEPIDRAWIAEEGRRIEVEELGVAGGRQDHYAATHGGALALTFDSAVTVRRLALTESTAAGLVSRSILVYTGESRISGDTIEAVLGAYQAGDKRVIGALARMKELASQMADALERGDVDAVGDMLGEHWEFQRSLHASIPTTRIDEIVRVAREAGARGSKAMGASGGGCVLVIANENNVDAVRRDVATLGTVLDFALDDQGVDLVSAG